VELSLGWWFQYQERTDSLTSIKAYIFVTDLTKANILTHVLAVDSTDAHFVLGGQRHPDYQAWGGFRQMDIQNAGHHERLSQVPVGLSGAVSVSPGKRCSHD